MLLPTHAISNKDLPATASRIQDSWEEMVDMGKKYYITISYQYMSVFTV